ncbi:RNA 2',3'-cyclic phosphodiesterase [Streptomyces sp. TRM 70351]|uniref:RNA 2',3'-cyclic phosphodiesterase n=1 Tax=Streptomyces sp. TRM 70351 TaxID=3116552 RepID=UPI002E7B96AE|nr:RNA 2',3'-cyclic phosphodiesterase [Streptomyces sp. TRM 70351]MEE1929603.1 RNA 2',3'-cyclic phosphodiesterase [Streptomyces sp. TRM 70351]
MDGPGGPGAADGADGGTARLFAALLPPPPVLDGLRERVTALREAPGAGRLRWTEPDGWHLTLAFYGAVPGSVRPGLDARLERAARRGRPAALELRGAGRFGDRALWADVADAEPGAVAALARLAGAAEAAGRRAGTGGGPGRRRFTPHLTLARSRNREAGPPVPLAPYVERLADHVSPPWRPGRLALVRSHLPVSGVPGEQPRYETVAAWPLGDPARTDTVEG